MWLAMCACVYTCDNLSGEKKNPLTQQKVFDNSISRRRADTGAPSHQHRYSVTNTEKNTNEPTVSLELCKID